MQVVSNLDQSLPERQDQELDLSKAILALTLEQIHAPKSGPCAVEFDCEICQFYHVKQVSDITQALIDDARIKHSWASTDTPPEASSSPLSNAEFLELNGDCCPFCKSDEIEGGSFDVSGNIVSQEFSCNNCDAEWYNHYQLIGYSK